MNHVINISIESVVSDSQYYSFPADDYNLRSKLGSIVAELN